MCQSTLLHIRINHIHHICHITDLIGLWILMFSWLTKAWSDRKGFVTVVWYNCSIYTYFYVFKFSIFPINFSHLCQQSLIRSTNHLCHFLHTLVRYFWKNPFLKKSPYFIQINPILSIHPWIFSKFWIFSQPCFPTSEGVSGASERANRRASGPVLTSRGGAWLNVAASWRPCCGVDGQVPPSLFLPFQDGAGSGGRGTKR